MKKTNPFKSSLVILLMCFGFINAWGQTPNGILDFGNPTNGTTATTANTGFGGIRVGSGGGGFTLQNPGQSIGELGELRGVAPTGASINSVGITSTEYGTSAAIFTVSFDLYFSGGSSGTWYFFAGNGTSFNSAQSSGFTGNQVFTGIRWQFGASNAITTNNRNSSSWATDGISSAFSQNTVYSVTIIGNNTTSTVNYTDGSVAAGTYDLWINNVLVGDNLSKGQLGNNTNINAFRFYGESSTGNVAQIALDNITWYNTVPTTSTYSVTYDGNTSDGGSAPVDNNEYEESETVTVLGQSSLAKTGYHFIGWNTSADGTGDDYVADDTFEMPAEDVTLYAQWAINTYTITYDGNGNDGGTAPVDNDNPYDYNSDAIVLGQSDLTKTDYNFVGWNTAADGNGTAYAEGNTIENITSDIALYAQWIDASLEPQTITFDTLADKAYGDASFQLTATASSGLTVSYSSSDENVATVTGNEVTIVGIGTTTITASQAGDEDYQPAEPVQQTLIVNQKALTIDDAAVTTKVYDGTTAAEITGTLSGVVGSDDVSFTGGGEFASADAGTGIAVTANLSLTGADAGNYTLTQPSELTGTINKADQTLDGFIDLTKTTNDPDFDLPETTNAGLTVSYNSDNEDVATIVGNIVTITGVGTTTITATQDGDDNWSEFEEEIILTVTSEPIKIAGWDFNNSSNGGTSPQAPTNTHANVTVGGMTRGEGITVPNSPAARAWGGQGWNANSKEAAISGDKYATFTIKANEGTLISLSSIDPFEYRRSGTGASEGILQYSLNGTDFIDIQPLSYESSSSSGSSIDPINLSSISALQNVNSDTTITFRIVNWGGTNATGTWYLFDVGNDNTDDFVINGYSVTLPTTITWTTDNEWSNEDGPGIDDDAIIEGTFSIADAGLLQAKNLNVAEGGSITIASGGTVELSGKITNEGNFTVQSGGNLIQTSAYEANDNVGDITVQRESQDIVRLDYTFWSSPVNEQLLQEFSSETLWNRIYTYETNAGNLEDRGAYEQVFESEEDADFAFANGKGYLFRAPNNWDIVNENEPAPYMGTFTGTPFNGNANTDVYGNGGFTSVGNPYPSNIRVTGDPSLYSENAAVIDVLFFWNNPPREYNEETETWEYTGTKYVTCSTGGCTKPGGDFISVGQGFIVRTLEAAPTESQVTFTNSMRVNDATEFLKTEETERHRFWLSLSNADGNELNQILTGYMTGATNEVDQQIDGELFGYEGSAIYNVIGDASTGSATKFVIQGRALPFETSDVVPLGFRAVESGKYRISLTDMDGIFAEGQTIYLKDRALDTIHNLSESAYEFESPAGEFNTRFEIVYEDEGTMGTGDLAANAVQIYTDNKDIVISSKAEKILSVELYDLQGRKLHRNGHVNANDYRIKSASFGTQVLIVRVQTQNGEVTSKKVINN